MNVKNIIEEEIDKINKLYEKTFEEITSSFVKRHENLIAKEKELKEELQNKVTQIKEKLENLLSESISIIKVKERINKNINILEKEEEKNIIKILSHVSKIYSNINESYNFLNKLMTNLNPRFQEKETRIKYQEYFFNGIQIPKNIQTYNLIGQLKVIWDIDDINNIYVDKNKIKYRLEIKKGEEPNEKFKSIYEGNKKECFINNLSNGQKYEIRICILYEDIIGPWSDIHKFLFHTFDSVILSSSLKGNELLYKIKEWCGDKKYELLYRGSRDGSKSTIFHDKCDNKGPTLCLYKNKNGNIFGGYTSISWTRNSGTCLDLNSFIFTLTNDFGVEPTRFYSKSSKNVHHKEDYGPSFGEHQNDISIYDNYLEKVSSSNFPEQYNDTTGKGKILFTGNYNKDKKEFIIKEIEVYKIIG